MFDTLTTDNDIQEEKDTLGGFQPLESDLYPLTITVAYGSTAKSGAMAVNIHFETEDGKELRQTFYVTSGTAKGKKNYYENKKTGKKHFLPGFNMANNLCLLTVGKPLSKQVTEDKVINLYDSDQGKEVPTTVKAITALKDQKILAGVLKQIVDKVEYDESAKEYKPTGETRLNNEADKFFRLRDGLTVQEIRGKQTEAVFKDKWIGKWKDQVDDKSDPKAAQNTGTAGAPGAPAQIPATEDIFA